MKNINSKNITVPTANSKTDNTICDQKINNPKRFKEHISHLEFDNDGILSLSKKKYDKLVDKKSDKL